MAKIRKCGMLAAVHKLAVDLYRSGGMDRKTMHNFDRLCLSVTSELKTCPKHSRPNAGKKRL